MGAGRGQHGVVTSTDPASDLGLGAHRPLLLVFAGLPGSGKTTVSRMVAARLRAAYVRVDAIEAALWRAGVSRDQPTGLAAYVVGNTVAAAALAAGTPAVVDAVNAVGAARDGWTATAAEARAVLRFVEIVCPDPAEHRRRVTERFATGPDSPGLPVPIWEEVAALEWEPWEQERLLLDSTLTPDVLVEAVLADLSAR